MQNVKDACIILQYGLSQVQSAQSDSTQAVKLSWVESDPALWIWLYTMHWMQYKYNHNFYCNHYFSRPATFWSVNEEISEVICSLFGMRKLELLSCPVVMLNDGW